MVENLLKQRKNLTQRDTERDWFIDEKGEMALSVENQYLTLLRQGELEIMKSYATSIPWEGRDTSGECRLHSIACVLSRYSDGGWCSPSELNNTVAQSVRWRACDLLPAPCWTWTGDFHFHSIIGEITDG